MVFRANEAADGGFEKALQYLIPRDIDNDTRARSRECVSELVERCGPVVDCYPDWHPLVAKHDPKRPVTTPGDSCGYKGIDHTVYFRNGFVTCPYDNGGQAVLECVRSMPYDEIANIHAEPLDATLYHPSATPILVYCDWKKKMLLDGTIPKALAVPMILEREVPCYRWSELAEPWETMRPYLLGGPCGRRSSLFINQDTGSTIKKIWQALIETGAFGPIKVTQR